MRYNGVAMRKGKTKRRARARAPRPPPRSTVKKIESGGLIVRLHPRDPRSLEDLGVPVDRKREERLLAKNVRLGIVRAPKRKRQKSAKPDSALLRPGPRIRPSASLTGAVLDERAEGDR